MGDPSYLRFVPASSAAVTIDWRKVPEASKKFLLEGWGHNWFTDEERPLPPTIGDLAKMLDESKFFGYMEPQRITLILDISEFGLDARLPTLAGPNTIGVLPVGPRFYMKYQNNVWVVLFMPGKREGITAFGPTMDIDFDDDDDYDEEREAAKDRALAEEFDPRICDVVSRFGQLEILANGKIAGWTGNMLSSDLEQAQLLEVLMKLPMDHPVHRGLMQGLMKRLGGT